jgi:hypothetical protein
VTKETTVIPTTIFGIESRKERSTDPFSRKFPPVTSNNNPKTIKETSTISESIEGGKYSISNAHSTDYTSTIFIVF